MDQRANGTDKTNAVIYARVSSTEQEKEGFSIPAQLKLLGDYASGRSFHVVAKYVDVETAKQAGRTQFGKMVGFLGIQKNCRTILVEKTDRLYRNIRDWVMLDDLDLEIHFVKENAVVSRESRSSEKFIHGIKVLMAKNYVDNLSEETRKGMLEKAQQGIYPSFAPLGYTNVAGSGKRHIQPDPSLARFIAKIYEWYASGRYSLLEVTNKAHKDGFVLRTSRAKAPKSTIYKILTNPIYHGEFNWAGKRYIGSHEPIITKEMFERVQKVLQEKGRHLTRHQRYRWTFQGLVRCGHCGCALVAEIKKQKFVYYHCTGHRGKCPEKYAREEELDRQFQQALGAIRIDEKVLNWILTALKESHGDEKKYHDESIARLQKQHQTLQNRLDAMYVDKLDGNVSHEFFDRQSQLWRREQSEISTQIEAHRNANVSYLDSGVRILELAQRAELLYEKQNNDERRRLLEIVFSNSTWKDGLLAPAYKKPFDLLAETNHLIKTENAAPPKKRSISDNWLPGRDSNPRPIG
jgi:site-specific DNA recombinase